jgi:hypothetical protein
MPARAGGVGRAEGAAACQVGWWAMFITTPGDMTEFVSMIFGHFFLDGP